jgi:transcriptional regulator GlxA family with amidase domain
MCRAIAQKARHILLLDRVRSGSEAQPHPPAADEVVGDERVRRALLLMEQHVADPLPIAQLAGRLSISPRQLERLFQSVMGVRPAQHYRLLRLRYARWLLDHTDLSITEIALDSGFADCAHFSRKFKALHGFTPTDARARERGGQADEEPGLPTMPPPDAHLAAMRIFE